MNATKIDVHHHVFPPQYMQLMEKLGHTEAGGITFPKWSPEATLANMDQQGIRAALLSLGSPGVYFGDRAAAKTLARESNEYTAKVVADNPSRLGFLAAVPLPDAGAAVIEAAYAFDVLGADGVSVLASNGDRFLGDPSFEELMQELDRRQAVVHVHPTVHRTSQELGLVAPGTLFEFIADTSRAALNLVLTGTLERYPNIRWILSHAGGTVPYLAWRWALADTVPHFREKAPKGVMTYLKKLYYDTALAPTAPVMKMTLDLAGPGQVLFGSDYAYVAGPLLDAEVKTLDANPVFDAASREAMESGNALKLFPALAARIAKAEAGRVGS